MAKGRPVKNGEVLNPHGCKGSPTLAPLRRLTHDEIAEVGSLLLYADVDSLTHLANDPAAPALRVWICNVILKGIENGDVQALSVILDRLVGKVKDKSEIEISAIVTQARQLEHLTDSQIIAMAEEAVTEAKKEGHSK